MEKPIRNNNNDVENDNDNDKDTDTDDDNNKGPMIIWNFLGKKKPVNFLRYQFFHPEEYPHQFRRSPKDSRSTLENDK